MKNLVLFLALSMSSAAFAAGQYYTTCSGKDSKGNAITISVVDLNTNGSTKNGMVVELKTSASNYRYLVNWNDIDSQDVYLDVKSKDNGGITVNCDGDGGTASGRIGVLKSTFSLTCTPGAGAQ